MMGYVVVFLDGSNAGIKRRLTSRNTRDTTPLVSMRVEYTPFLACYIPCVAY